MATTNKTTQKQAEATLAAIKKQFALYIEAVGSEPKLVDNFDFYGLHGHSIEKPWGIVWEEGPMDWALLVPHGGREPEFGMGFPPTEMPKGVWAEPYASWAVSLYKD